MTEIKSIANMSVTYELKQVLQRRHLINCPVEYLVKARDGKLKEVWMSEEVLVSTTLGKLLLKTFEQTKVGERGIDLYIGKRRSLSSISKSQDGAKINGSGGCLNKSLKVGGDWNGRNPSPKGGPAASNRVVGLSQSRKRSIKVEENVEAKKFKKTETLKQPKTQNRAKKPKQTKSNAEKNKNNKTEKTKLQINNTNKNGLNEQKQTRSDQVKSAAEGNRVGGKRARNSVVSDHHTPPSTYKSPKESTQSPSTLPNFPLFHHSNHPPTTPPCHCCLTCHPQCHHHPHCCFSGSHKNIKNDLKHLPSSKCRGTAKGDDGGEVGSKADTTSKESSFEGRINIRQIEPFFQPLTEISVRRMEGVVQVVMGSHAPQHSPLKNSFNPKTFTELITVLDNLAHDECGVVLLSGSGSVFTSGIDLSYLISCEKSRKAGIMLMAEMLRDFTNLLISFPKPLVAVVNGAALGLGVAMLPLFDMVYASDKASFYCPYTLLAQSPEACSSYTFPRVMGFAMANELLMRSRKITALEACQVGLVSQVIWPENLMNEVMARVKLMSQQSAKTLQNTKALMRADERGRLAQVSVRECAMLAEVWPTSHTQHCINKFLEAYIDSL